MTASERSLATLTNSLSAPQLSARYPRPNAVFWLSGSFSIGFDYCAYCEYFEYVLALGIMAIAAKKPTPLPKSERQQVQNLERLLRRGVPALISPAGGRIELPGTVVEVLRTAVEFMSHGQTVTL